MTWTCRPLDRNHVKLIDSNGLRQARKPLKRNTFACDFGFTGAPEFDDRLALFNSVVKSGICCGQWSRSLVPNKCFACRLLVLRLPLNPAPFLTNNVVTPQRQNNICHSISAFWLAAFWQSISFPNLYIFNKNHRSSWLNRTERDLTWQVYRIAVEMSNDPSHISTYNPNIKQYGSAVMEVVQQDRKQQT